MRINNLSNVNNNNNTINCKILREKIVHITHKILNNRYHNSLNKIKILNEI